MAGTWADLQQARASSNGADRRNGNGAGTARQVFEAMRVDELARQKRRMAQLSAAGKRIDVTTRDGRKTIRKPDTWQDDVWTFYDTVPEIKFAGRFFGNAGSRLRLYPGVVVDPDEDPVPVDQAVEDPEIGLPASVAEIALDETDRLTNSADGMSGIMRGFMENIAMVGECYLLGRSSTPEDPVLGDEYWQVYSTSAVTERDDQIMVQETPKGRPTPLPPGADPVLYRIWRRHARWPGLADSNMAAVLDECEEIVIYGRLLRSIGRSLTMAGFFKLPSEIDFEEVQRAQDPGGGQVPVPDPEDQGQSDGLTALERAIMTAWVQANEVEGSPAAVASFLLRGKAEHLKEAKFEIPNRPIDDKIIDRMNFLIQRIAHGADLPTEVLTGVAEANHWTGWQIEDATYKAHVEPTAQIPASALTAVFLRPALDERGVSADWLPRMAFGLDASALVVRPNRGQDARDAFDSYAISWEALRGHLNFSESEKPSPQELVLRAALAGNTVVLPGTVPVTQPPQLRRPDEDEDEDGENPEGGGRPTPDEDDADSEGDEDRDAQAARSRVILTAASVEIPGLGEQLVSIESRLRDRLMVSASDELRQVLRRAGNKLRSAVQGTPERRRVNGADPEEVGRILGAERAAELVTVDELLEGAFEPLRIRWDSWVPEAEAAAISTVIGHADTPDPVSAFDARAEESDHAAGWTALFLGLMALARARLFAAVEAEDGEALTDVAVPAGIVRDALAVAGGGQGAIQPTGPAAAAGPPGLLTGPRWRLALRQLEIEPNSWKWQAGFPTRPFPPHQSLSGTVFRDWQDDQLTAGGTFPATSHYYPGDHRGCLCDAVPIFSKEGR
jgi:hypothetical protein